MTNVMGIKRKDGQIIFGNTQKISPVMLEASQTMMGVMYKAISQTNGDNLFSDPADPSHNIMKEITRFLDSRERYHKLKLAHKRGVLLYGPPGTGKTATVSLLCQLFLDKTNGVVVTNGTDCLRFIRSVIDGIKMHGNDIPLMIVFDDISYVTPGLLSVLDGQVQYENIVFLFTTNYYSKLPPALKRPSRTDLQVRISSISDASADNYCKKVFNDNGYHEIKALLTAGKVTPTYALLKEILLLKNIYETSTEDACKRIIKINKHIVPDKRVIPDNDLADEVEDLFANEEGG